VELIDLGRHPNVKINLKPGFRRCLRERRLPGTAASSQNWSIGSATNSYSAYPIAPRQWFLTLSAAY
jgi:hypothetical protein